MRHTKHTSKTRTVMYAFFGDDVRFDCEKVLAHAKAQGIVTNYDDGRDRDPWFEAPPGPETRALRDKFLSAGYVIRPR